MTQPSSVLSATRIALFALVSPGAAFVPGCSGEQIREPERQPPVTAFAEISSDFQTLWNEREATHPFTGGAVIDVDQDGVPEVFVSGGRGQDDLLLRLAGGRLVNVIAGTGLADQEASYGPTAIDMNDDGRVDLLLARNDGVFLYLNRGGRFTKIALPVQAPPEAVPFSVSAGDIDLDGDLDLYISYFVAPASFRSVTYNDPEHAKQNRLLLNLGSLKFQDITASAGAAGINNTFFSTFVDLNDDSYLDLVLVQNTGEVELLENRKNLKFVRRGFASGYGVWMGVAVGDIDRDGDQDLLFTNAGVTVPAFLTSGDLRDDQRQETEWLLLRNEGDFRFTDASAAYELTGLGFAWGALFEDLNLDGELDLLVAQNYIKWPPHKLRKLPGKTMLQLKSEGKPAFYHMTGLGLENRHFGQTPLIVDLDGDGRPDVLWLNMHGPVRAFLNRSENAFLALALPDNAAYHGATVVVETAGGRSYAKQATGGSGLLADSAPVLFFGLGRETKIERLTIRTLNGQTLTKENPKANSILSVTDFE